MTDTELIFVYNADSNLFSTVTDFAHKLLSPSTYQCHLCALTYGNFTMKQEWKSFIESLPVKSVFLHKDEFIKQHTVNAELPAVFILSAGLITELLSRREIESCQSLEELKSLVEQKIDTDVQYHHTNIQ